MLSGSQIKLAELISTNYDHSQNPKQTEQTPETTQPPHIIEPEENPISVEVIEELIEQIQQKEERLRELNRERNTIHKSLRGWRERLDDIMDRFNLEVIVKNGKEYRKKTK